MQTTNPPAFPRTGEGFGNPRYDAPGMSLRDWYAGRTMSGIVASIDGEENYRRIREHAKRDGLSVSEWIARDSFKQADAMLSERGRGRPDD